MSKLNDRTNWRCMHKSYDIDRRLRTVTCSKCEAELDAFDILHDLANREGYHEMMAADAKRLAQRVAFLKGEERKVKARTKTANRRDAKAAVEEEKARHQEKARITLGAVQDIESMAAKIRRQIESLLPPPGAAPQEKTE